MIEALLNAARLAKLIEELVATRGSLTHKEIEAAFPECSVTGALELVSCSTLCP